jgi:signal transduction histidine kinase
MITSLKHSRDPVWFVDKKMNLTDFNMPFSDLALKFYGLPVNAVGSRLHVFKSDLLNSWDDFYDAAFAGESFSKEIKMLSDNREHYFDVTFNPIGDEGEIEGVAVFAKDVTQYKSEQLNLIWKINELNSFMYKATHDLRSPLMSLMGLVGLADKEASENNEQLSQYFSMIGKSVTKMDNLLLDLVTLTNVTQGRRELSEIEFDALTDEILESIKHSKNFDRVRIIKNIGRGKDFYSDKRIIYSVMQNLIDNSVKYSRMGENVFPFITICVEFADDKCCICIDDNGIGIPAQSVAKVFEMFYRAADGYAGTGLGLYIVKKSVEKLKGSITLESIEKRSTSVKIILPNLKDTF